MACSRVLLQELPLAEVKLPCQTDTHSLEAASFQGLVDAGYKSLALLPTLGPLDLVPALDLPAGPSNAFEGYLPGLPALPLSNIASVISHSSCSPRQSLINLLHTNLRVKEAVFWRTWGKFSFSYLLVPWDVMHFQPFLYPYLLSGKSQ